MLFNLDILVKKCRAIQFRPGPAFWALVVATAVILPFSFCCAEGAQDKIAAIVNNEIITGKELNDYAV